MKEEDDFLATYFNFGIIIKGELKDITKLKEYISKELYNSKILYQKISTDKLLISPDK